MKRLALLLPFLLSCYATHCHTTTTTTTTTTPVGPLPPPVPPYHPADKAEITRETYSDKANIVQFNADQFVGCSALEITYDGVNYGLILVSDDLYLPKDKVNDKHTLEITCIDDAGKGVKTQTLIQIHPP